MVDPKVIAGLGLAGALAAGSQTDTGADVMNRIRTGITQVPAMVSGVSGGGAPTLTGSLAEPPVVKGPITTVTVTPPVKAEDIAGNNVGVKEFYRDSGVICAGNDPGENQKKNGRYRRHDKGADIDCARD